MALVTQAVGGEQTVERAVERPFTGILRRYVRHRLALISTLVLLTIILMAVFAPWITPWDPNRIVSKEQNLPPFSHRLVMNDASLAAISPTALHLLGTDNQGRDLFTRLLYAARISLTVAFVVVLFGEVLGVIVGAVSGYAGGWVDSLIMRVVDFILTLPLLPILLVLVTIFKPSVRLLILILVLFNWTTAARLMRGQILSLREQEFIQAARALSASPARIIFRHLIPNAIAPVIVNATLALSAVVVLEAVLSFLGFGVQPPNASWGNMLQAVDLTVLDRYAWQAFFPGLAIFLTSLCFNFMGDGLRDALDPRLKI
ncbi:MAG: oligopeptide ABC transporter permease AppC [Herpetosiphon sp.]